MAMIRITSIDEPLRRPGLLASAIALVRRAAGVGLLAREAGAIERLDLDLIRSIAREASAAGVGGDAAVALLQSGITPRRLRGLMDRLEAAIVGSPVPPLELAELVRTYGVDHLAGLLGIAPGSLRRYAAGARATPDEVAARLHFLALVTSDLAGSYNEVGLRRWWDRPRTALDRRSPRQVLGQRWAPEDEGPAAIASLAAALVGGSGAS